MYIAPSAAHMVPTSASDFEFQDIIDTGALSSVRTHRSRTRSCSSHSESFVLSPLTLTLTVLLVDRLGSRQEARREVCCQDCLKTVALSRPTARTSCQPRKGRPAPLQGPQDPWNRQHLLHLSRFSQFMYVLAYKSLEQAQMAVVWFWTQFPIPVQIPYLDSAHFSLFDILPFPQR